MKKNLREVMDRWLRLVRREMPHEILLSVSLPRSPAAQAEFEGRDQTWKERDCLCNSDAEWVVRQCQLNAETTNAIEDDTLPSASPHVHFGESVYSGLLGGKIRYIGSASHTCSGAEPLLPTWDALDKLRLDDDSPVLKQVLKILELAACRSGKEFFLGHFILIDALNLAVELRGTTQAYTDLFAFPDELRRLMEFGIELNEWFLRHQERVIGPHNRAVSGGHPLTGRGPMQGTVSESVDAYTLCHPRTYVDFGLDYQSRLLQRIGGAMMHMHGTAVFDLLPHVAKLKGLLAVQVGNDLHGGESFPLLPRLREARSLAGDVPLDRLRLSAEEFELGIRARLLVGNAHYVVPCESPDQARRYIEMARNYRAEQ